MMKKVELKSLSTKSRALRKRALNEYLLEGGFPELMNEEKKRGYIEALLNSIIKNDIAKRFKVRYVEVLRRLAEHHLIISARSLLRQNLPKHSEFPTIPLRIIIHI